MSKAKAKKKAAAKPKKKPNGRPPLFKTPRQLQAKVDEYFKFGRNTKVYIVGKGVKMKRVEVPLPTITGLVLYMGFCDRQSFYDMEKRPEFSCTIKTARTRIENHYEELAQVASNPAGPIFALKNFGWKDKTTQVHDVTDEFSQMMKEIRACGDCLPIKE